jgi:hypothetical protein
MTVEETTDPTRSRLRGASALTLQTGGALVEAVGNLADAAVDHVLLTDRRVTSAAEGKQLLAGDAATEALTDKLQRVVTLAVPTIRVLVRGARFTRVPWAMIATSTLSIGVSLRAGVRELQVLASLIAHRLEQATGAPADPVLVKKLAIDLYLKPNREPKLTDDKLRLARLTRKWVFRGAFGKTNTKRAGTALDAAERLDVQSLAARWVQRRSDL